MIKKAFAAFVMAVFLLSIAAVSAQAEDSKNTDGKNRLEAMKERNEQRLAKIESLDKAQQERLAKVNEKNVEKIAELKKERLDKIAKLSEKKLERISELEKTKLEKISDLNDAEIEKASSLGRERLKMLAGKDQAMLKAELAKIKVIKVKNAEDIKLRKVLAEKKETAKKEFEKAREEYKSSKEELKAAGDKLKQLKENGNEAETIAEAKKILLGSVDRIISHLQQVKSQIEQNEQIEESRASAIIQDIDAKIKEFEALKPEIGAATAKEQVREIAKKIKGRWANAYEKARTYSERIVTARVEGVVNRAQVLEKKLDSALSKLKERGIEVDAAGEMAEFSALVEGARIKVGQTKEKLEAARKSADKEQAKKLVDEAKSLIGQAKDALKNAHEKLKEIVKKAGEAGGEIEIEDEAEVEVGADASVAATTA